MDSLGIGNIAYLLYVVPGFVFIWTYRHFSTQKEMGAFEYAVWSFVWGAAEFLLFGLIVSKFHLSLPSIPLNDPASLLGGFTGMTLALVTALSFPLGFAGAILSRWGLFEFVDNLLRKVIKLT